MNEKLKNRRLPSLLMSMALALSFAAPGNAKADDSSEIWPGSITLPSDTTSNSSVRVQFPMQQGTLWLMNPSNYNLQGSNQFGLADFSRTYFDPDPKVFVKSHIKCQDTLE